LGALRPSNLDIARYGVLLLRAKNAAFMKTFESSENDRHVACFAHNLKLSKKTFNNRVYTSQVAPTVLQALGFDPKLLQGVRVEKTEVLNGFERKIRLWS
jgi:hypothetical protein